MLAGKRVVICEDEAITVMQLKLILANGGLQVVGHANNAPEAIELIRNEKPDIVIMDCNLSGTSGLSAVEEIRRNQDVCVVILTGYPMDENRKLAEAAGVAAWMVKPVTGNELLERLKRDCGDKSETA